MNRRAAIAIVNQLKLEGEEGISLIEDYSGRSLGGRSTTAIAMEELDFAKIARAWAQACVYSDDLDPSDLDYLRCDQLGMRYVVY